MRQIIKNEVLSLEIAELGAEMKSLKTVSNQSEWLWQADPDYWPRTAPVLFPIVGKLVDDQYLFNDHLYPLSQHGFARDRVFNVVESQENQIRFHLASDYESEKFYPFSFDLYIGYRLDKNWLWIDYEVINKSDSPIYFSLGGHPGFSIPGFPERQYFIEFEKDENPSPYLLNGGLLMKEKGSPISIVDRKIPITNSLFNDDALVFEGLRSTWIGVQSADLKRVLKVHYEGFPWLGIWSKPGAPFVCVEPWFGHADWDGDSVEISKKHGIQSLSPGGNFSCRFGVEICTFA